MQQEREEIADQYQSVQRLTELMKGGLIRQIKWKHLCGRSTGERGLSSLTLRDANMPILVIEVFQSQQNVSLQHYRVIDGFELLLHWRMVEILPKIYAVHPSLLRVTAISLMPSSWTIPLFICSFQVLIASDSCQRTPHTSAENSAKWASSSTATMTHPSYPWCSTCRPKLGVFFPSIWYFVFYIF